MASALDFYAAHGFWVWAAAAAALLAVEALTGSGWLLWPAVAAGVVAMAAQFAGLTAPLDVVVFAGLTIVATFASRRLVRRVGESGADINDNAGRVVGHHGQTVAAFKNGEGRVFIDGKEWAATLVDGGSLPAGARVLATGVDGARLSVRRLED